MQIFFPLIISVTNVKKMLASNLSNNSIINKSFNPTILEEKKSLNNYLHGSCSLSL